MEDRRPEKMSPAPPRRHMYGLSMMLHTCADTHTWVLQWWWGLEEPERLISHHGGKLKGCQLSLCPSSVSCCLLGSAPCCVFWFKAEGKDRLWSKLGSWIKNNGLAHYWEWTKIDGSLENTKRLKSVLDMINPSKAGYAHSMGARLRVIYTSIYLHR